MNIRFYNARILTMEEGAGVTEGELWVKGNRIAPAGPPDGTVWDREIDARGNLLLPGFKNAHTHSGMTFLRSYADDQPLHDWLQECFPMEAKLRPGDVYDLTRLAIMEYLTSGITANFDMYMFPDEIAKAAADCGFRTVLCGCVNNFTYDLPFMEKCWDEYNRYDELVSFILGFHAEYTCSRELLEGMAALAHKYEAPVFTHNSETRLEVDGCLERWGMTPTAFLDSLGMFDYGGGGYHGVYLNDADLEIFRRRGLWMVTNPGSNVKLASGIAPLQKMLDAGVSLALGTDGRPATTASTSSVRCSSPPGCKSSGRTTRPPCPPTACSRWRRWAARGRWAFRTATPSRPGNALTSSCSTCTSPTCSRSTTSPKMSFTAAASRT